MNEEENKPKMTIAVRNHISIDIIESLLESASHGAGYWAEGVGALAYDSGIKQALTDEGIKIRVDVNEDGETIKTYTLNRRAIKRGLALMARIQPEHYADVIGENTDANTGDVLLQCALLGGIIYG